MTQQDRPPRYSEQYRSHVIRVIGDDHFGLVVSITRRQPSHLDGQVVGCTTSVELAKRTIDGWQDE